MAIIDRHADLQAVVDDAFRRGAEAMRETTARTAENFCGSSAFVRMIGRSTSRSADEAAIKLLRHESEAIAAAIRALPLPEPPNA